MPEKIFQVVARSGLNLRLGPGPDQQDVGNLPYGAKVEVLEAMEGIPGDWAPIRLWVAREYLGEISAPREPPGEEKPVAAPPEAPAPGPYDLSTKAGTKAAIAAECRLQGIGLPAQIAYVLATADHETGGTFQPVREAPKATEAWREEHFRYFPFYGRGLVQLTWENNYRSYSLKLTKRFGVPVDLVANPDEALQPEFSLFILVDGFKYGAFTGKKITDYINADEVDFVEARRCINGQDCAEKIAALAEGYLEGLQAAEPIPAPGPDPSPSLPPTPVQDSPQVILQADLARAYQTPTDTWQSPAWTAWFKKWGAWIDLSPWAGELQQVKGLWSNGKCGFWGNKALQEPINKVFALLAARDLLHEIETFEGCWCVRLMKDGTHLTVHSWALALDFNALTNPFGGGCTWSDAFLQTWAECGWECGAIWDSPGTDAMHFQYVWTRDWRDYEPEPLLPKMEGRV